MEKIIAICGLTCTDCPAYVATQKNDDEERKRIAELWSTDEWPLKPEDIDCDGCVAIDKRLAKFCHACEVRQCGLEKKVDNCAYCDEYICEKLAKCVERSPEAKATLEEIRKSLQV